MKIFPAIDLYGKKAVRLFKGDYAQMPVFNDNPVAVALDFKAKGAKYLHVVDLEGAKTGAPEQFDAVARLAKESGLFLEIGGGVRNMETIERYFNAGASRVILGTAAVEDEAFLKAALQKYGEKIAVGADVSEGKIAIRGWLEKSKMGVFEFLTKMEALGVKTVICTDVSKDGAMKGANHALYKEIKAKYNLELIASGGVSSLEDIKALKEAGVDGAIIGKAYYIGAIDLQEAIKVAR